MIRAFLRQTIAYFGERKVAPDALLSCFTACAIRKIAQFVHFPNFVHFYGKRILPRNTVWLVLTPHCCGFLLASYDELRRSKSICCFVHFYKKRPLAWGKPWLVLTRRYHVFPFVPYDELRRRRSFFAYPFLRQTAAHRCCCRLRKISLTILV